jgi:hypothetical protein
VAAAQRLGERVGRQRPADKGVSQAVLGMEPRDLCMLGKLSTEAG